MEQQSSTSKVTVEYFDPHNVYKLLAPGLLPRLTLRNLHWQSHAGPIRSIDKLHIDLSSGDDASAQDAAAPRGSSSQRPSSSSASRDDGFQTQQVGGQPASTDNSDKPAAPVKAAGAAAGGQRRHQIPGLRSTPYLKVLLVRCDDNDSYKATVRSEIREWIKTNTMPATGSSKKASKQEKHDAYEWLIVHVIIPNTVAATQPRSTAAKAEIAAEKGTSTSRWRTGSTPLLEKLRSDFNSSTKGAPDRVAQVRIGINDVPYDMLPRVVPAVPSGYSETEADAENAWNELVVKLKSLILTSFDMRVTQYEEDIKEKDAQRSLPGWNFCTFFILKEGLARGFENVGLVEDALVGYDELSVGLDTVIHEQVETGEPERHGGAMLPYTEELHKAAKRALAEFSGEDGEDEAEDLQSKESSKSKSDDIPISSAKKAYRDMILANKVSVFDFRCYIFSRQLSLLLRSGNALATREALVAKLRDQYDSLLHGVAPLVPPMNDDDGKENLSTLSEICRRTLEFIPSISQVLRQDIAAALLADANQGKGKTEGGEQLTSLDPLMLETVDNLVSSFAFAVAQQILAQTSTKALPIPPSIIGDGQEPKSSIPEPKTMMHPARTTSLHMQRPPASPGLFPGPGRQYSSMSETELQGSSSFLKVGLEELAARRAELYMLCRSILEGLGKKRAWSNGWAEAPLVGEAGVDEMEDVSLDDDDDDRDSEETRRPSQSVAPSAAGIENNILRTATDNVDDFYRLYEILTDKALRHFTVASHENAMQACNADMAVLKFHVKEYKVAAVYFPKATPFFGRNGWSLLELSMLVMYSQCLSELERNDDYVDAALTLLTKSCAAERERLEQKSALVMRANKSALPDQSTIRDVTTKLFELAKNLSSEVKVALTNLFADVRLDGSPSYHEQKDGCTLHISLRSLLPEEITMDEAKLRVTNVDGGPVHDITLESHGGIVIKPGVNKIPVKTNSVVPGHYRVSRLGLVCGKLFLHHEQDASQRPERTSDVFRDPDVALFQRSNVLDVQVTASKHIALDKDNSLDLAVITGWNSVKSCDVRVRSTTGGLRMLTTEAKFLDDTREFTKPPEPGSFSFGAIAEGETVTVRYPYSIEQDLGDVSAKVEVTYVTEAGETFYLAKSIVIPVSLAVGVNVQDVFKHETLFSRFNVSTASYSPLRLYRSELLDSTLFSSEFGFAPASTITVFPKQPATLLYKVKRKLRTKAAKAADKTMYLKLHYSVLQTEIEDLVQDSVRAALADTSLSQYSRLLAARVLEETRKGLQVHDLERAALLGEVTTAFMEGVPWARHFAGIGNVPGTQDDAAVKLAEFLADWQKQHRSLPIPSAAPAEPCTILIPVEIPSLFVVHTADMRIDRSGLDHLQGPGAGAPAASVNQMLPATLHLKWTRVWDTDATHTDDGEFSYEVTAPGDSWILGGRRKGHFVIPGGSSPADMSSTPETEAEIPLMLIPQREGYLPYPSVDIKEVPAEGAEAGSASCEVDWRNLGETVRVVSERKGVTVSLDASGPGGGPLAFDHERMERQKGRIVA